MPRKRANPYEITLHEATKRLEKANAERQKCEQRLVDLNIEIPRLQEVIQVTERFLGKPQTVFVGFSPPPRPPEQRTNGSALEIPEHLKDFMPGHNRREGGAPENLEANDDAFLEAADISESGNEVLE